MIKIIECHDGFRWVDGNTSSAQFPKDSEQYKALISKGCAVELIPQAEKDAHKKVQVETAITQKLAALDAPLYKIERAIAGDQKAIDDIKEVEALKAVLRAELLN